MAVKDIIFDEDIEFSGGDLKVEESDQQHIEHIMKAKPGQFYQNPTIGVGIDDFKNSNINQPFIKQKVKENLEADNYRVNGIDIITGGNGFQLSITAKRLK